MDLEGYIMSVHEIPEHLLADAKHLDNFLELDTIEQVNKVDMRIYTFLRFSDSRSKYIFKKRREFL